MRSSSWPRTPRRHHPRHPPPCPLFIRVGGAPFTRFYLIQEVQRLALANGIAGKYTSHSFRRGAATWASRQGLGSEQIQKLGRWKSAAYQLYIDTTEQDKVGFRVFCWLSWGPTPLKLPLAGHLWPVVSRPFRTPSPSSFPPLLLAWTCLCRSRLGGAEDSQPVPFWAVGFSFPD